MAAHRSRPGRETREHRKSAREVKQIARENELARDNKSIGEKKKGLENSLDEMMKLLKVERGADE